MDIGSLSTLSSVTYVKDSSAMLFLFLLVSLYSFERLLYWTLVRIVCN
jgi:hypothetical protein